MHSTIREASIRAAAAALAAALALGASPGCSDDEPARSEKTQGGENAVDRAGGKVDRAHQNFKREVKPAATWVDEKTRKAVDEGKKAARKTADAIDETVDGE